MIKEPLNRSATNPIKQEAEYRSFCYLLCLTLNACLSSFFFGYSLVYLNTISYSTVQIIYNFAESQQSSSTLKGLIMGCVPVGAGVGAIFSSILLKKFSLKSVFLITNIVSVIAISTIQVKTLYTLLAGRIIQGVCVGLYSAITPLYINQMLPQSLSGMGALNQAVIALGQSFAFLFAYILSFSLEENQAYFYVSSLLYLTLILQTVLFLTFFNFNPPRYLFDTGQREKALEVLQKIYKEDDISKLLQKNKMSVDSDLMGSFDKDSLEPKFNMKIQRNTCIAIFAAIHIALAQQFSGVNAVVTYGVQIVNEVLPKYKQIVPIIINAEPAIASVLTSLLLTRLGRKSIIQLGCLSIAITLGLCVAGFLMKQISESFSQFAIIGGLVLYMMIFGLTLGPVVWLYIPEFVTQSVVPFSTLANWTGASICVITFPIIKEMLPQKNPGYLLLFFLVYMLLSIFINAKFLIQTKGKSRQQVMQEYQQSSCV